MRLPLTDPKDAASVDIPLLTKMVDLYMARGNNYFDIAFRYCNFASEPALKETLTSRYPREAYELTNKITLGFVKTEEEQEPYEGHPCLQLVVGNCQPPQWTFTT